LLGAVAVASLATVLAVAPAFAVTTSLSQPQVIAHFDISATQQPENITVEPDGSADLTFAKLRQIVRVGKDGTVTVLGTLPAPSTGMATATGIVRTADGTLYVNYNAGTASGIYRLRPGGTPEQIAALPQVGNLNGLALDEKTSTLYATDAKIGGVWRVSLKTGTVGLWASGELFQPNPGGIIASNGIKVHNGAVWVGNTDKGTLTRVPIRPDGTAGTYETAATGLSGMDDFAFTGAGDTVVAAINVAGQLDVVQPDGTVAIALTSADGLDNPTSVAVRANTVYIASGAYFSGTDPNLLQARITH
jgi:sugar lactone lactonase YvrE